MASKLFQATAYAYSIENLHDFILVELRKALLAEWVTDVTPTSGRVTVVPVRAFAVIMGSKTLTRSSSTFSVFFPGLVLLIG